MKRLIVTIEAPDQQVVYLREKLKDIVWRLGGDVVKVEEAPDDA